MTRSERLSPVEAIMWRVGQDTTLRMTVGGLALLDRLPERAALLERLDDAADEAPRLRWRLDDPSRRRARPAWVDDDDFDAADHVRTMAVPSPGGTRAMLDLIEMLEHQPFHPDHSPWDVTIIEGLEGGRGALYVRADHALTDGLGGMAFLGLLFDVRSWRSGAEGTDEDRPDGDADLLVEPRRAPGTLTLTVDFTKAARPVAMGLGAVRSVQPLDLVVRGLQHGVDVVSSVSRQMVVTGGPLSPLRARHPTTSRFEVATITGARRAGLALGGSRNDFLVAGTAAALGAYHEQIGLPCSELRLAVPTSRRHDRTAAGNWFSLTRVEVPTDGSHPAPQFGVISERLARARSEPAVRYTETLAAAVNRLPARVLIPALQAQAGSIDFVTTAVPGYRRAPQICGAAVTGVHPFGRRLGCLVNVAAFGNEDRLDVGLAIDPTAIEEPAVFVDLFTSALDRLAAAAAEPGARPAKRAVRPAD